MHKFTMSRIVAAGLLGMMPTSLSAQDTLRVDQARIDGSFIESFSVVWRGTPTDLE